MTLIQIVFWLTIILILYPYFGYPFIIFIVSKLKQNKTPKIIPNYEPTITVLITAYNEAENVNQKVENTRNLIYNKNKIKQVWVTDGSTDQTNSLLENHTDVKVFYEPKRQGKINAMNRAIKFIDTDIVIFTDANTLLNNQSIQHIVNCFSNPAVGCVAGEKRIINELKENAAAAGEGIYWQYESFIKKIDAKIGTAVGAAGELFAVRRELFQFVAPNTILDDFEISMRIAMMGYKIDYNPNAYAIEKASVNINEEMKRKIRIAAGSIQSLLRLKKLLNPFYKPFLWFQYLSHKVFRWVVVPVCLPLAFLLNIIIAFNYTNTVYSILLILQILFYLIVYLGSLLKNKNILFTIIFVPYYFFIANYAMWLGFIRYCKGRQTVNWERAKRA